MTEAPEIIMYGTTWCGQTRRARALLDRNNIPYRWIDIILNWMLAKLLKK